MAPKVTTPTTAVVSGKPSRYQQAKKFAQGASGYDSSSPIWGKTLEVVLDEIETAVHASDTATIHARLRQLRQRIAYRKIMGAQR